MNERHPVEKSPPYHLLIWIIAGLVATAIVYGVVQSLNVPPVPPLPPTNGGMQAPPANNGAGGDVRPASLPKIPFTDITREAGISFTQVGGAAGEKLLPESGGSGCAWIDYDGDGDADLLLVSGKPWEWNAVAAGSPRPKILALFRNDKGKFTDVTSDAGLASANFYGQGVAVGDYDSDGDDDFVVTALGGIYAYRNDGGKFTDVTAESGLKVAQTDWPTSTGFFDYDHDGDLDLFVVNYVRWTREADQKAERRVPGVGRSYAHPDGFEGTQNFLFRNDGGKFTDVSAAAGIHVNDKATGKPLGKGLALTFVDFDRDGWLDVFVSNDTVPHFLYRNKGDGTYEEVAIERKVGRNADGQTTSGMSADAAWVRSNDELAIAVGNFADERTSFFVSLPGSDKLKFVDESVEAGIGGPSRDMLSWGLLFDDFDLDRRVDLAQTNGHLEETIHEVQPAQTYAQRGQLFWNLNATGPKMFAELPAENTGDLAKPIVGRALASADIDGDGDLDLIITGVGGSPRLLRNDQRLGGHWLRVRLVGAKGNPHGIGALIELRAAGVTQRRTLMPTRSYLSQTEAVATFGLGDATEIESLIIRWPDGGEQIVVVKGVDRVLTVERDVQTFAVLANIAKAQLENDDLNKAIVTLERALKLQPKSLPTRRNLARAHFLNGQHQQALDDLKQIDAESPSAATAYLMGLAALHLFDAQKLPATEAVTYLRRAAELDPNDATIRYQLAQACSNAGDAKGCDEQLQKTIELNPLHGRAQYQLAIRIRRDPEKQDEYRRLMRDYDRILAMKGGEIPPATLEVCQYTKFEPAEIVDATAPATTGATKFAVADIAPPAGELPPLAGVAPLFLQDDGRYQLVGVTATGDLLLLGFDDAGHVKVLARGAQPLGPVDNDAIVLVGNTRRDPQPPVQEGAPNVPQALESDQPEIAIITPTRSWFVRYQPANGFTDLTAESGLSAAAGTAARWVDLDLDLDIDLCVGSAEGFQAWRNNGDGTFAEATAEFGLNTVGPATDIAAADLSGWNTGVDLVVTGPAGGSLWKSQLGGQFKKDAMAGAAWSGAARVVFDDFTNDGRPDIALVSPASVQLVGAAEPRAVETGVSPLAATIAIDISNIGRLDLIAIGARDGKSQAVVHHNRSLVGPQPAEPGQPVDAIELPAVSKAGGVLALDIDGDCDTDLLMLDTAGKLHGLRNERAAGNRHLIMSLASHDGPASAIGARVEVRRDSFLASRWLSAELPVEIGVGQLPRVDTVQSLWTNGLAKNEIDVEVNCQPLRINIIKFVRQSSCPFLYTWVDGHWQFATDILGIAPLNVAVARGVQMPPDQDEVAILGLAERFADGPLAARLRITNELREITILDQLKLLAVDHAADVTVFSRDRVATSRIEGPQIIAGKDKVALRSAIGSDGIDRTAALAHEDDVFAEPGRLVPPPVVGFTEPLALEFEFDNPGDTTNLFLALTGWFRFGTSSTNIAASQNKNVQAIWPKLEVQNAGGEWQLVDAMVGMPSGNTKTIVCDLAGKLPPGARRFRLTTSFEVRWDELALYHKVKVGDLRVSEVSPSTADLRWYGFNELVTPSIDKPSVPNLARHNDSPPWYTAIEGWCTRYGDVQPLVAAADQKSLVLNAGDGATIDFPAAGLPPRVPGQARTLLLYSNGWVKSGDVNDLTPMTVAPFPGSDAPTDASGDWQLQYNTRWVPRERFSPTGMR